MKKEDALQLLIAAVDRGYVSNVSDYDLKCSAIRGVVRAIYDLNLEIVEKEGIKDELRPIFGKDGPSGYTPQPVGR